MARYTNPVARGGDFADPFVLRHDGRYYLYATNPDVPCWSSLDLIDWHSEGPTIPASTFPGLVPFAPEVVYDDGAFFMYTSPSGHGHVVLRSDSATGPFVPISPNVGHAIDGHVFVDDDGSRYFYWAGNDGIWGCSLRGAADFGEPVFTGVDMNGWTEGPFVIKRDGVYLMTLTGNHYLSPGYRIDAASSDHPLHGWRSDVLSPILVSTRGDLVGLGHSSSVVGPDLVSTWIAYHNFNPDASRDLDLDRQVHSGRSIQVLGPTRSAVAPVPPDEHLAGEEGAADWDIEAGRFAWDPDGFVLQGDRAVARWRVKTAPTCTAELCLTGDGGIVLDELPVPLPAGLRSGVLHTWRLEAADGSVRVLVDGRLAIEAPWSPSTGIRVGTMRGPLRVSSGALTRRSPRDADRESLKPVPGRFWAALGVEGSSPVERVPTAAGAERVRMGRGASMRYELDVSRAGSYRVHVAGDFAVGHELVLEAGGTRQRARVDASCTLVSWNIAFEPTHSVMVLESPDGGPLIDLVTVAPHPHPGPPEFADKTLTGTTKVALPGRYDDVEVRARLRVTFAGPESHADLLVRADQLADGGEGDDPVLGADFLLGYSVQLHADRVVLARHDYATRVLATHSMRLDPSVAHDLVVGARGGSLTVELDGQPILDVADALPHVLGHIGMRTGNAALHIESLRVASGARA